MSDIRQKVASEVQAVLKELYDLDVPQIDLQETRKEFEGDVTLVVFPYLRASRKKPEDTAAEIGSALQARMSEVAGFNVVKGFLNIVIGEAQWSATFRQIAEDNSWGFTQPDPNAPAAMVEYSSPNTNKPLHLGHVRNILLGTSVSRILKASGRNVVNVQIVNDRGIHICKSMLAWQKFGEGETPESTGMKGDKLVGKYYVEFDKRYRAQQKELVESGMDAKEAEAKAPLMIEAQEMLQKWEAGDDEVVKLWKTMNQWVYDGFDETYERLGAHFDKNYYESETYILGKADVERGLESGVFYRREDGSVWIDLTDEGLDEKLVLRKDGTSVYITQDIGTAIQRFADFNIDSLTYVVGNEQDYHFKVLFLILGKLGYEWAEKLYHLSYGMVDLPSGKMKSREGTVVDADDLMNEMISTSQEIAQELGKVDGIDEAEQAELYRKIGLGALKYFILRVDAKRRMMFNPEESIDFAGNTGPFIQYTYARIQSLKRKAKDLPAVDYDAYELDDRERELIKSMSQFPKTIQQAADELSPSIVAAYVYDLTKQFNGFYQNTSILNADTPEQASFRLKMADTVGGIIERGLGVLGIEVPERM